jgi:hypothetical protein
MLKRHILLCGRFTSALLDHRSFVRVLNLNVTQKANHFIF